MDTKVFYTDNIDEITELIESLKNTLKLIDQNDSEKYDIFDAIKNEINSLEIKIKEIKASN